MNNYEQVSASVASTPLPLHHWVHEEFAPSSAKQQLPCAAVWVAQLTKDLTESVKSTHHKIRTGERDSHHKDSCAC